MKILWGQPSKMTRACSLKKIQKKKKLNRSFYLGLNTNIWHEKETRKYFILEEKILNGTETWKTEYQLVEWYGRSRQVLNNRINKDTFHRWTGMYRPW